MYGKTITYEQALDQGLIDQMRAWEWITRVPNLQVGQFITNPLRPDSEPNCYIRKYKHLYLLTDFAFPQYNKYTCVHAVAELMGNPVDLSGAATLINRQQSKEELSPLQINQVKSIREFKKTLGDFTFEVSPFVDTQGNPSFHHCEPWKSRGFHPSDLQGEVLDIHHYYINGKTIYPRHYPCYCLLINGHKKLYQPFAPKRQRFPISNVDNRKDIWTCEYFPPSDICFITKGYKDWKIMSRLLKPYMIDVYGLQNEGVIPDPNWLSMMNNVYQKVYIVFDNDVAGIVAAYKLIEYFKLSQPVFYPMSWGNDTDDVLMNKGEEALLKFLLQWTIQR